MFLGGIRAIQGGIAEHIVLQTHAVHGHYIAMCVAAQLSSWQEDKVSIGLFWTNGYSCLIVVTFDLATSLTHNYYQLIL